MKEYSSTYFCGNGHLVDSSEENEFCDYDDLMDDNDPEHAEAFPECHICRNEEVYFISGWPEDDRIVSKEPERIECVHIPGRITKDMVNVECYDISCLKKISEDLNFGRG